MNDTDDVARSARLEERFLEAILAFPGRLDVMETRDEEACRRLAARLAGIAEREFGLPTAER